MMHVHYAVSVCHLVRNAVLEFAFYCTTMLSSANHVLPRRISQNLQLFPHKLKRAPQDYGDQLFVRIQDAALAK